jgi:hypothetical protein
VLCAHLPSDRRGITIREHAIGSWSTYLVVLWL